MLAVYCAGKKKTKHQFKSVLVRRSRPSGMLLTFGNSGGRPGCSCCWTLKAGPAEGLATWTPRYSATARRRRRLPATCRCPWWSSSSSALVSIRSCAVLRFRCDVAGGRRCETKKADRFYNVACDKVEGPYVRLVHTQWGGPLKGARVSCVPHLAYQNFQIRNWGAGTRGFQRSEAKAKSKAGQSTRQSRSRSNDRLGGKLDKRRYTTEVRCRRRAGTSFTAPSLRWSWSWSCVDCPLCRKVDCPENTKEAQLRCRIRPK